MKVVHVYNVPVRADSKLVRAMEDFVKKKATLSWRLGDRSQNVIDGRNGLSRKNTITLKKKFSKIDKKFVSQSILEVDPFNIQQKVVFFQ